MCSKEALVVQFCLTIGKIKSFSTDSSASTSSSHTNPAFSMLLVKVLEEKSKINTTKTSAKTTYLMLLA